MREHHGKRAPQVWKGLVRVLGYLESMPEAEKTNLRRQLSPLCLDSLTSIASKVGVVVSVL